MRYDVLQRWCTAMVLLPMLLAPRRLHGQYIIGTAISISLLIKRGFARILPIWHGTSAQ